MDVLRSLLVSLEIICFICTVYDSYYTLLWDGVFVKGRDSHERYWNSVRIVCALILCVTAYQPYLFRRHVVSQVYKARRRQRLVSILGPGVVFCTLLYAAHGPGYSRLRDYVGKPRIYLRHSPHSGPGALLSRI